MKIKTVALLSGGKSSEREVSLKGGNEVFNALDKTKYNVIRYDPMTDIGKLVSDASKIDVAFILLHGPFGEDGTVQGLLDLLEIPYQGAGVLGSALSMNKVVSKQMYEKSGIPIPSYIILNLKDSIDIEDYIKKLGFPIVVKPSSGGSSIGMSIVKTGNMLKKAIDNAFSYDDTVILEQYIKGIELTCGVIGNDKLEALPLVEIIPNNKFEFFDYEAKYTAGATQEICPARVEPILAEKIQEYAKAAHKSLYCRGYSRTDMILAENKAIYILETNTIPGMTTTSLLPLAAKTCGISFSELLDRLIELALEDKKR
ncbi:MAG: D-alanine--D-alanine ligase [Desulfobacterales bacterium]|nr:D-alanine--D-alanine ligase [Desulfobacterales bacterium]